MSVEVLTKLLDKFPAFDPMWGPESRQTWLQAFSQMLGLLVDALRHERVTLAAPVAPSANGWRCVRCGEYRMVGEFAAGHDECRECELARGVGLENAPGYRSMYRLDDAPIDPGADLLDASERMAEANAKPPTSVHRRECAVCGEAKGFRSFDRQSMTCRECLDGGTRGPSALVVDGVKYPRTRAGAKRYLKALGMDMASAFPSYAQRQQYIEDFVAGKEPEIGPE